MAITNFGQFSKQFHLHDTIELKAAPGNKVELVVEGDAALATEPTKGNLVHRAIEAARKELGWKRGVHATLTKRIPVGRGLGGGSSDAAAALIGMMRLAKKEIPAAPANRNWFQSGRGRAVFPLRRSCFGRRAWG